MEGLPEEVGEALNRRFGPIPGISTHEIIPTNVLFAHKSKAERIEVWRAAERRLGPANRALHKCHTRNYWVYYLNIGGV